MVRNALLLLLATLGTALPYIPAQQPSTQAVAMAQIQRDKELHARAEATVNDEHARAEHPLCPHSPDNSAYGICMQREQNITDANETKLVRTLGVIVRAGYQAPPATPGPLSFDKAEASWHLYRDQVCASVAEQYAGGVLQGSLERECEITVARHHMDELWAIYKDIG